MIRFIIKSPNQTSTLCGALVFMAKSVKQKAQRYKHELTRKATEAELVLCEALTEAGVLYEFQKPIYVNGSFYIVDFFIKRKAKTMLFVECDGHHHFTEHGKARDERRLNVMKKHLKKKVRMIRFSNNKILNDTQYVVDVILKFHPKRIFTKPEFELNH